MNPHKSQMFLGTSILLSLLGLVLFNLIQVTEPALAQIAPTATPRRVVPTINPRRQAPNSQTPFRVYLPMVFGPADSFTLINQDLASGLINLNQATAYKIYALFKNPLLPSRYQSSALIPQEGTVAYLETLANWEQLDATT